MLALLTTTLGQDNEDGDGNLPPHRGRDPLLHNLADELEVITVISRVILNKLSYQLHVRTVIISEGLIIY
jgi:hypothetical protein